MPRREHLLKIGVSGIRGVVGDFLTPTLVTAFAQAFGTYVGGGRVVVGRDTRRTGEMIQHAVSCGLLAAGCEVMDVGIQTTPTLQIYVAATRARGGLAVTASHNPPQYNALKMFNSRGLFFNQYERAELLDLYHQSEFRQATNEEMRRILHDADTPPRLHIERVLRLVDAERIRRRRFRVALDAVNGAGSRMSCHFLELALGCELHAIAVDPELPFPRPPEPRPEALGDLVELVRRESCDIGFAQDPDGDRLAVVDENGRVLDGDEVLGLAIEAVLERQPGDIVVNLTTSALVDELARRYRQRVFRTPVGEANVVETMLAVGAVVGGEGSNGGFIFPAVHACRDSYVAMALLLDRMAETGRPVSVLAANLPRFVRRYGQAPYEHGRLGGLMQELEEAFPGAELDRSDGLKVSLPHGWIHLRASNTEPVLRLAAEARTEEQLDQLWEELRRRLGLLTSAAPAE